MASYSSVDKAHLRLASAKGILRLSKHWDEKIPVDIFYLTLRTSEVDSFPLMLVLLYVLLLLFCFFNNRKLKMSIFHIDLKVLPFFLLATDLVD